VDILACLLQLRCLHMWPSRLRLVQPEVRVALHRSMLQLQIVLICFAL
jgi:hypothetical protein